MGHDHPHDHGHTHDHGHGHHDHHGNAYYLDQLCTIGACGALGVVSVILWARDLLFFLTGPFASAVLVGGVALIVLSLVRAAVLWRHAGRDHGHTHDHGHHHHDHEHGPDCQHDHDHAKPAGGTISLGVVSEPRARDHGHDHSDDHHHHHDHGWTPIKYPFLLIPVLLFLIGIPNPALKAGFDTIRVSIEAARDVAEAGATGLLPPVTVEMRVKFVVVLFLSILFEALPFIVLGSVVAGFLEAFVPSGLIARLVPKSKAAAIGLGGLLGLLFPMCECGIVPVMRRLMRKGLPLGTCVAYMLAGPIINFVVISSTVVAFSPHNGGWGVITLRVVMGFVVAFVTALVVDRRAETAGPATRLDAAGHEHAPPRTAGERLDKVTETALHDFVDIMVFLVIGATLAAGTRFVLSNQDIQSLSTGYPMAAIAAMMGLAVVLCLCSEADAFVAAAFTTLHPAAKLAFLVLGPMLDIKLLVLFTRVFTPWVIRTIVLMTVAQVFLYSTVTYFVWESVAPFRPGSGSVVIPTELPQAVEAGTPKPVPPTAPAPETSEKSAPAGDVAGVKPTAGPDAAARPGPSQGVEVAQGKDSEELNRPLTPLLRELSDASYIPRARQFWEGRNALIKGMFMRPINDREIVLARTKTNCCSADTLLMRMRIVSPEPLRGVAPTQWLEAKGRVNFALDPATREYAPYIKLASAAGLKPTNPEVSLDE